MSTFLHYVHCKDALLDCSAPGGERCESLTWVDEIGPLGIKFSEILVEINAFSFKKMHLKMSSARWCLICLGLNVLSILRCEDTQKMVICGVISLMFTKSQNFL